jgi:glutamate racemase
LKIDALCNQVKAFSPQVIVLGCTHFVFLKEFLQKQLGDGVHFVDSSEAVAKQIDRLLPTSVGLSKAKSEVNILTNVPLSEAEKARIASVCLGHDWSFADWLV